MRSVRVVCRSHDPRVIFALTGAQGTVSGGSSHRPEDGIEVTFTGGGGAERRGLPGIPYAHTDLVFSFLVGWVAGKGLDVVAAFIVARVRGTGGTLEINDQEVLVEESAVLEALRRATEDARPDSEGAEE